MKQPQQNVYQCEHEDCTSTETTPCSLTTYKRETNLLRLIQGEGFLDGLIHYWHILKDGYTTFYNYYCIKHAKEEGFCWCCGGFWSGVESFDFNNSPFCENCREDEYEDDYYEEEDYYEPPDYYND